ncbi:MAG: ATP-dependent DNA helicase RecG [Actinomycetota bacterium]
MVALSDSVRYVTGVGPKLAERLGKLGIETAEDLLRYYPRRYLDRSTVTSLDRVKLGSETTVIGRVVKVEKKFTPRQRKKILTVDIADGAGYLSAVWFNNWWHADKLKTGTEVSFSGKVVFSYGKLQMTNPAYDILGDGGEDKGIRQTGRIIPLYPASADIQSNTIRRVIDNLLEDMPLVIDPLPVDIVAARKLPPLEKTLRDIHRPDSLAEAYAARRRLIYDEFFFLELGLGLRKARLEGAKKGIKHQTSGPLLEEFFAGLPFELTVSQLKVIDEILADMSGLAPMHRLLQGEVGSGKTAVAVAALTAAVQGGYQGAIMAPTEVLAEQHALKIRELLPPSVKMALLTGSTSATDRAELLKKTKNGSIDIIAGTHAVIQEGVEFKGLGLAVIDEQHRFGVRQRLELKKKGTSPDILVMTATPIPRTLALTLYGDLDASVIDEMPSGRRETETIIADQKHRDEAYELIRQQVATGRQVFVVTALVDESDKVELKAATAEAERLKRKVFPDLKVAVMHGQMKSEDKQNVMNAFRAGDLDILITTTVIEVGIDVPNATVMLIEDAERFGLSQLHQLRGRIGRGEHKSFCVLFTDSATADAKERIKAFAGTTDGFALAEADLRIRGEGQLFGTRQSGLPDLKIASVIRDFPVLQEARGDAFTLVGKDPKLKEHQRQLDEVKKRFGDKFYWLMSG